MADPILLREWLTVRLPASIGTTGLFAAGVGASGKAKARDHQKAPRLADFSLAFSFLKAAPRLSSHASAASLAPAVVRNQALRQGCPVRDQICAQHEQDFQPPDNWQQRL